MRIHKIITFSNGKKCVEFEEECYSCRFDFLQNKWERINTFRLDKENLLIRIENLKKQNMNYDVEQFALSLL